MSEDSLILEHIKTFGFITPAEGFTLYGCSALHSAAARLRKKLRPLGLTISCTIKRGNGKMWGEYRLIQREAA